MKDLEKIKSEEVAAQVQDANPGNFAIEQEVAQLVGATVPAPTEPGADDARELGAQLLVFLRRALTPIKSALRTAVAAIYAHLDSRCTDYTPAAYAPFTPTHHAYDPMGSTPRTLPNLLTALTAFSDRKISNGSAPSDGIPDGTSLAHLLCGDYASVTKLIDDNPSWGALRENFNLLSIFPNLTSIQLNCKTLNCYSYRALQGATGISSFAMPYLETIYGYPFTNSFTATTELDFPSLNYVTFGSNFSPCIQGCGMKKFTADNLEILRSTGTNSPTFYNCPNLEEIHLKNLRYCNHWGITTEGGGLAYQCANLRKVVVGDLSYGTISGTSGTSANGMGFSGCPKLVDIEVGANGVDVSVSMDMRWWNPSYSLQNELTTFLQNFREHIALRLTANGSGKTLTLSQAVRNAIHAAESTYGIENIIVTQKGWTISPAPN